MSNTTGVPSLDVLLGDGLQAGDNVVLLTDEARLGHLFADAFVEADPRRTVWTNLGAKPGPTAPAGVEVLSLKPKGMGDIEASVAAIVEAASTYPRLVISGLDTVHARAGAEVAIELYRLCCPRLFDLGAIACWPVPREAVGATVTTRIGRIAQVVLDIRRDTIRVVKAEGRNGRLQGVLAELHADGDDGRPLVGRDLVAGRLGEGLKRLRRDRSLTQRQLADMAGVTPAAISQAETGRRGLSLETLVSLCEALGTGLDDLLGAERSRSHVIARRDGRPVQDGMVALLDTPGDGGSVYRVELEPGASGGPPFAYKGPELVLVARGLVLVDLGEDTPVMRTGDALRVVAEPIEGWTNLGTDVAELFWLAEPATR